MDNLARNLFGPLSPISPGATPRRPGIGHLVAELSSLVLLFLWTSHFIRPFFSALPSSVIAILGLGLLVFWLIHASVRWTESSRVLQPELPALQRVAMGDATDERERQAERKLDFNRSWTRTKTWGPGFLLANLALMVPWPHSVLDAHVSVAVRLGLLTALHLGAALLVTLFWVRARKTASD